MFADPQRQSPSSLSWQQQLDKTCVQIQEYEQQSAYAKQVLFKREQQAAMRKQTAQKLRLRRQQITTRLARSILERKQKQARELQQLQLQQKKKQADSIQLFNEAEAQRRAAEENVKRFDILKNQIVNKYINSINELSQVVRRFPKQIKGLPQFADAQNIVRDLGSTNALRSSKSLVQARRKIRKMGITTQTLEVLIRNYEQTLRKQNKLTSLIQQSLSQSRRQLINTQKVYIKNLGQQTRSVWQTLSQSYNVVAPIVIKGAERTSNFISSFTKSTTEFIRKSVQKASNVVRQYSISRQRSRINKKLQRKQSPVEKKPDSTELLLQRQQSKVQSAIKKQKQYQNQYNDLLQVNKQLSLKAKEYQNVIKQYKNKILPQPSMIERSKGIFQKFTGWLKPEREPMGMQANLVSNLRNMEAQTQQYRPPQLIHQPFVDRKPRIMDPMVQRKPPQIINQPLVQRKPPQIIKQPLLERKPQILQPLVQRRPPQIIQQPSLMRKSNEPLLQRRQFRFSDLQSPGVIRKLEVHKPLADQRHQTVKRSTLKMVPQQFMSFRPPVSSYDLSALPPMHIPPQQRLQDLDTSFHSIAQDQGIATDALTLTRLMWDIINFGGYILRINPSGQSYYLGMWVVPKDGWLPYHTNRFVKFHKDYLPQFIKDIHQFYNVSQEYSRKIICYGLIILIKDLYKGKAYYGVRMTMWADSACYPTRNGFNLRHTQIRSLRNSLDDYAFRFGCFYNQQ